MKKLFAFICLLTAISFAGFSQNSLEFSQVLLFNTTTTQTVPSGKVWKVEQFLQPDDFSLDYVNSPSCSASRFHGLIIGGTTYYPKQFGISNTNTNPVSLYGVNGALWLPAGTNIALQCANDLLSILEFNVIP